VEVRKLVSDPFVEVARSLVSYGSRLRPSKLGRASFACYAAGCISIRLCCSKITESDAIPTADRSLRRAVAQASDFLSLSVNDFSASSLHRGLNPSAGPRCLPTSQRAYHRPQLATSRL
jgi:hypothetical protein